MKLIIAGASGFCASEVVRQALVHPKITSIIALTRRVVDLPEGADTSKLKIVQIEDYEKYSDEAKKEFAGAGGCIWSVAITPSRSVGVPDEEILRVNRTCTTVGMQTMYDARPANPFRFLYMSGFAAMRDRSIPAPPWVPQIMHRMLYLRGDCENDVVAFAAQHPGFESTVAKVGHVLGERKEKIKSVWMSKEMQAAPRAKLPAELPVITVEELAAAMIHSVVEGFESEPLLNADLVRIGRAALGTTEEGAELDKAVERTRAEEKAKAEEKEKSEGTHVEDAAKGDAAPAS